MPVKSASTANEFNGRPPALAWSREGSLVAYAVSDGEIVVVITNNKENSPRSRWELRVSVGADVDSLSFAHNDRLLACGTEAGEVIVWGRLDGTDPTNTSPAGWKEVARGSIDSAIQDAPTLVEFSPIEPALAVCRGDQILLLRVDEALFVASTTAKEALEIIHSLRILELHRAAVNAVAISPNGQLVVSGSSDKTLRIWNPVTGRSLHTLEGHTAAINAVAISPDGQLIVSGSSDKTLRVWDLESLTVMQLLKGHKGAVNAVAIAPNGQFMVSGSSDNTLRIWDLEKGKMMNFPLVGHVGVVSAVAITFDGRQVVSASRDKTLRVWDLMTGDPLAVLEGHEEPVNAVAITPDGRLVVSGSKDKTLRIWDLATRTPLAVLEGHDDSVNAVAITTDGRHVISGSKDKTLRMWDLMTFAPLAVVEGHKGAVNSLSITPDGLQAVSGSSDETLRVWGLLNSEAIRSPFDQPHSEFEVSSIPSADETLEQPADSDESQQAVTTSHDTLRQPLKIFISYSHAQRDYVPIFINDFLDFANFPDIDIQIFSNYEIPIGMVWDVFLQDKVADCNVMILLVSQQFLESHYIRKKEFGEALKRLKSGRELLLVPIYFAPCNFESEEELLRLQFFKPSGERFGEADKGNNFSYIDMVKFRQTDGQLIPNSYRKHYMMELMTELGPELKKLARSTKSSAPPVDEAPEPPKGSDESQRETSTDHAPLLAGTLGFETESELKLLQSMALAFHVRAIFPDEVRDDKAVAEYFHLSSEEDRGDFNHVRKMCEYLFSGPVKHVLETGEDPMAPPAQKVIEDFKIEIAKAMSDASTWRIESEVRRIFAVATSEDRMTMYKLLGQDPVRAYPGIVALTDAELLQGMSEDKFLLYASRYMTVFHRLFGTEPTSLARATSFHDYLSNFFKKWSIWTSIAVPRMNRVEISYGVEKAYLDTVKIRFPQHTRTLSISKQANFYREQQDQRYWEIAPDEFMQLMDELFHKIYQKVRSRLEGNRSEE